MTDRGTSLLLLQNNIEYRFVNIWNRSETEMSFIPTYKEYMMMVNYCQHFEFYRCFRKDVPLSILIIQA